MTCRYCKEIRELDTKHRCYWCGAPAPKGMRRGLPSDVYIGTSGTAYPVYMSGSGSYVTRPADWVYSDRIYR